MATTLRHLDQLLHTVERGRPLNVDESGRLPVRLYGPDGQPLFTEQNPAHVKGEVTLTGHSVLHELVWNPTPGSSVFRVFGETSGTPTQAIKPFDASRLAILYVRVINQSGASLWEFGPPHPPNAYGIVGLFFGSLDARAGIPNPNRLLEVAHGISYITPNEGVLTIRLSDYIGADADSEDAHLVFPRYGATGVKVAVRARAENTGGPITVQFIGGSVS